MSRNEKLRGQCVRRGEVALMEALVTGDPNRAILNQEARGQRESFIASDDYGTDRAVREEFVDSLCESFPDYLDPSAYWTE